MNDIDVIRSEFTIDTTHRDGQIQNLQSGLELAFEMINNQRKDILFIQGEYNNVLNQLKTTRKELTELKSSVTKDHDRLRYMDDNGRRNQLRFRGIAEAPRENWQQCQEKVARLLREVLGGTPPIERAHRVGRKKTDGRTRELYLNIFGT